MPASRTRRQPRAPGSPDYGALEMVKRLMALGVSFRARCTKDGHYLVKVDDLDASELLNLLEESGPQTAA